MHARGVALTVMLSLGPAIGLCGAIAAVTDAMLVRRLPYPDAAQLVRIDGVFTRLPLRVTDTGIELTEPLSAPELDEARSFSSIGAYLKAAVNVGSVFRIMTSRPNRA